MDSVHEQRQTIHTCTLAIAAVAQNTEIDASQVFFVPTHCDGLRQFEACFNDIKRKPIPFPYRYSTINSHIVRIFKT